MSSLDSNKNLAGIGAILFALGFIPGAGVVIGIIGLILLMMGLKGIADYYQDQGIYQNAFRGIIYGIIGLIAVAVLMVGLVMGSFGVSIVAAILIFIFYLLMAISFRKSFDILAQKTGDHMFETAGLILFIGAILSIIVVGLVLVFIAFLLAGIAFFSMKTTQPTQGSATPTTSATATRYCPHCGAPVDNPIAQFCPHCGKQLT